MPETIAPLTRCGDNDPCAGFSAYRRSGRMYLSKPKQRRMYNADSVGVEICTKTTTNRRKDCTMPIMRQNDQRNRDTQKINENGRRPAKQTE